MNPVEITQAMKHNKSESSSPIDISSMNDMKTNEENKKRKRSVVFENAEIVEFEPTIYTTTVTSGGVPVSSGRYNILSIYTCI